MATLSSAPALAQRTGNAADTSAEEFAAVDPYTKGERAAMEELGIVSFGPFLWAGPHNTIGVKEALGGTSVIFIETAHFRLASTLETYKYGNDRVEKKWLEGELAEFRKHVAKFKISGNRIDPWLRAHLWAQRLEAHYADFVERFALTPADFENLEQRAKAGEPMGAGPYLGQKGKFTVLLTEKQSTFGRYLRQYANAEHEYSYRYKFEDSFFFGANFEILKISERGLEIAFATGVIASLTANFVDGMRDSNHASPEWFTYGLAHWYARRLDERWNQWGAGGDPLTPEDKSTDWVPRVLGLVRNDVVTSWPDMMNWTGVDQIKPREHLYVWSRIDWLLEEHADKTRDLLLALTKPLDDWGPERARILREREQKAYADVLASDPEALDAEWRAWVLRTYPKRK